MLMPKRVKHRKVQRGRMKGKAQKGNSLHFGEYGLQALEPAWISNRQIEAARIAMTRHIKRGGKVWITIFPDKSYTKKPAETRQGSGKGAPEGWVAVVLPGRMLFEMAGVTEELAREAMRLASHKLPIDVRFVIREKAAGGDYEGQHAESLGHTPVTGFGETRATSPVAVEPEETATPAAVAGEPANEAIAAPSDLSD